MTALKLFSLIILYTLLNTFIIEGVNIIVIQIQLKYQNNVQKLYSYFVSILFYSEVKWKKLSQFLGSGGLSGLMLNLGSLKIIWQGVLSYF